MSGGYFDYIQFRIESVQEELERIVTCESHIFQEDSIEKFKEASRCLERAAIMVNRIDWFLSGDDSEKSFNNRWEKEMKSLEKFNDYKL